MLKIIGGAVVYGLALFGLIKILEDRYHDKRAARTRGNLG